MLFRSAENSAGRPGFQRPIYLKAEKKGQLSRQLYLLIYLGSFEDRRHGYGGELLGQVVGRQLVDVMLWMQGLLVSFSRR